MSGSGLDKMNISPIGPIRPIFKASDLQSSGPFRQGPNSGDQSEVEPPGPIPNPEVKRLSANGSGTIGPVRVGRRQVFARIQLTLGPGSFFARMAGIFGDQEDAAQWRRMSAKACERPPEQVIGNALITSRR